MKVTRKDRLRIATHEGVQNLDLSLHQIPSKSMQQKKFYDVLKILKILKISTFHKTAHISLTVLMNWTRL